MHQLQVESSHQGRVGLSMERLACHFCPGSVLIAASGVMSTIAYFWGWACQDGVAGAVA